MLLLLCCGCCFMCLFLMEAWVCLQSVSVSFLAHIHVLFTSADRESFARGVQLIQRFFFFFFYFVFRGCCFCCFFS